MQLGFADIDKSVVEVLGPAFVKGERNGHVESPSIILSLPVFTSFCLPEAGEHRDVELNRELLEDDADDTLHNGRHC